MDSPPRSVEPFPLPLFQQTFSQPANTPTKRPASSLLPAFEPLTSSPTLPRAAKRPALEASTFHDAYQKYPTPIPTSSTGILSSPPALRTDVHHLYRARREPSSAVSERSPLTAVPCVELKANGETARMGRSSHSSHFQLSANRLISRVHVTARYIASAEDSLPNRMEIVCTGWNGLKLHCQGKTYELWKGDTFTSETEGSEVMLDVQEARVRVQWPRTEKAARRRPVLEPLSTGRQRLNSHAMAQPSSPPSSPIPHRMLTLASPVSPTPARMASSTVKTLRTLFQDTYQAPKNIEIFNDDLPSEPPLEEEEGEWREATEADQTVLAHPPPNRRTSMVSDLADSDSELSDPEDENDPVTHSFGPFPHLEMSNFKKQKHVTVLRPEATTTASTEPMSYPPQQTSAGSDRTSGVRSDDAEVKENMPHIVESIERDEGEILEEEEEDLPSTTVGVESTPELPANVEDIRNHVANQLAFSRIQSTPLSTILAKLPAKERADLTADQLRFILQTTLCVGTIERHGKDAAGKPLESEYYYIMEGDEDEERKAAVDGLRKPSLRNCRKQHKQYYWKRPRQ